MDRLDQHVRLVKSTSPLWAPFNAKMNCLGMEINVPATEAVTIKQHIEGALQFSLRYVCVDKDN